MLLKIDGENAFVWSEKWFFLPKTSDLQKKMGLSLLNVIWIHEPPHGPPKHHVPRGHCPPCSPFS